MPLNEISAVIAPLLLGWLKDILCLVQVTCIMSEILLGIIEAIVQAAIDAMTAILNPIYSLLIYTPHPPDLIAWYNGSAGGIWGEIWDRIYNSAVVIASILLLTELFFILFFAGFAGFIGSYRKEKLFRRWMLALIGVWGWPFLGGSALAFVHYFGRLVAGVSTSGAQNNVADALLDRSGGAGALNSFGTAVFILVFTYLAGWGELLLFLALLMVYGARNFLLIAYLWAMPILLALWPVDVGFMKPLSQQAENWMQQFVPILIMTLPNAFLLRMGVIFGSPSFSASDILFQPITSVAGPLSGIFGSILDIAVVAIIPMIALIMPKFLFSFAGQMTMFSQSKMESAGIRAGQFEKDEQGNLQAQDGSLAESAEEAADTGKKAAARATGDATSKVSSTVKSSASKAPVSTPNRAGNAVDSVSKQASKARDTMAAGKDRMQSYAQGGEGNIIDNAANAREVENNINDEVASSMNQQARMDDFDQDAYLEAKEEGDEERMINEASKLTGRVSSDADPGRLAEEMQSVAKNAEDRADIDENVVEDASEKLLGLDNHSNEIDEEYDQYVTTDASVDQRMEQLAEHEDEFRKADPAQKQGDAAQLLNADSDTSVSELRKQREQLKDQADMYDVDETTIDHAYDTVVGEAEDGVVGTNSNMPLDTPKSEVTPTAVAEQAEEDEFTPFLMDTGGTPESEVTSPDTDAVPVESPDMRKDGEAVFSDDLPGGMAPTDQPLDSAPEPGNEIVSGDSVEERVEDLKQVDEHFDQYRDNEQAMKNIGASALNADENTDAGRMAQEFKEIKRAGEGEVDEEVFEAIHEHTLGGEETDAIARGSDETAEREGEEIVTDRETEDDESEDPLL